MTGPLTQVLTAFEEGAASLADVAAATGLSADVVAASVGHLVRMGRLEARELSMGCPGGGCSTCASALFDRTPGCGASGPSSARRGPALVALSLRRPTGA